MGIQEEGVTTSSMPRNEMGLGLAFGEARLICKVLYNLAKENSPAKDTVEIAFSGNNSTKEFHSRTSYVKRTEAGENRLAVTLKVEPATSKKGIARITLEAQAKENVYFCSANLSAPDALFLSYILRCGFMDTFAAYSRDLQFSNYRCQRKPEFESEQPTVVEEALGYTERLVALTRKLYNPDWDAKNENLATEIEAMMTQIIQGYRFALSDKW